MSNTSLKIGLNTDNHNDPSRGWDPGQGNDYNTVPKMEVFKDSMNNTFLPEVIVNLGDYVDLGVLAESGTDFSSINAEFTGVVGVTPYYTLGNHDVWAPTNSTRADWLNATGMSATTYSFDLEGFHIIVLDTIYRDLSGATSPVIANEWFVKSDDLTWLTADLASTNNPVIVFSHITFDDASLGSKYFNVHNRTSVRTILENSEKTIVGCFGGHRHSNISNTINNIDYYSLYAMTSEEFPANAFSSLTVYKDNSIYLLGEDNQSNYGTSQTLTDVVSIDYVNITQVTDVVSIDYVNISQVNDTTNKYDSKIIILQSFNVTNKYDSKAIITNIISRTQNITVRLLETNIATKII